MDNLLAGLRDLDAAAGPPATAPSDASAAGEEPDPFAVLPPYMRN